MSDERSIALADAISVYLDRKSVGNADGPGAYATNAASVLERFVDWADRDREVDEIDALTARDLEAYATELAQRTAAGDVSPATAHTYYAVVRAFLSWCVQGGVLETNPAVDDRAQTALPTREVTESTTEDRQEQRDRLEAFVRARTLEASDADRTERLARLREYALVAVLAHSGARGAELFRVPQDDRRTGATWADVDFYTGTIRVLGRSGRLEDVPMLGPARTALRRYRVALDPPTSEWPLFPTNHAPSVARRVRTVLADRGFETEAIDALLEEQTAMAVARERAIVLPAITTEGARSVLSRLCKEAEVDVDGESLTPRGVRVDRAELAERRAASRSDPGLRRLAPEQSIAVPVARLELEELVTDQVGDGALDE